MLVPLFAHQSRGTLVRLVQPLRSLGQIFSIQRVSRPQMEFNGSGGHAMMLTIAYLGLYMFPWRVVVQQTKRHMDLCFVLTKQIMRRMCSFIIIMGLFIYTSIRTPSPPPYRHQINAKEPIHCLSECQKQRPRPPSGLLIYSADGGSILILLLLNKLNDIGSAAT
mmetsp:Transcript_34463/g.52886  ORF Transcript_34463/g.52886 Transcript_34463/m.52886 type:complete len:165 (+) Transcript_34463:231-725(+)